MPEPTPGETAYETYVAHTRQQPAMLPWRYIPPYFQRAWEAAAQAVLEAQASLCPICAAELDRCNAKETPCTD